jgi:hypothetical protein
MPLPVTATPQFKSLLETYRRAQIAHPHLKLVTAAQWALESGWGTSNLAKAHRNYAGMKWRTYMGNWAEPTTYTAHDGRTTYCHFASDIDFIVGFWGRLDVEPAYRGWRNHVTTPEQFFSFIGPIWVGTGAEGEARYVRVVLGLATQIADVMNEASHEVDRHPPDDGSPRPWDRMRPDKPKPAAGKKG